MMPSVVSLDVEESLNMNQKHTNSPPSTTSNKIYYIYILKCINNTYYTGYTVDLEHRYQSHLDGTGRCKYTRSFKPLAIAQFWEVTGDRSLAMKIERFIKGLTRLHKENIIRHPALLTNHFPTAIIKHS